MSIKKKSKFYYDSICVTQLEDIPWYVKLFGQKIVVKWRCNDTENVEWEEGYLYDECLYQFDSGDMNEKSN